MMRRAEARDPGAPFIGEAGGQRDFMRGSAHGVKSQTAPANRFAIGIFGAADFFACHGVAGQESGLAGGVVFVTGTGTNRAFDAADVGDELMFTQNGRETVEPFEDGEDGAAEQDEIGFRQRR